MRSHLFAVVMHNLGHGRRRDGAVRWGLFHDTSVPSRYVETFIVESWAEHLRQMLATNSSHFSLAARTGITAVLLTLSVSS